MRKNVQQNFFIFFLIYGFINRTDTYSKMILKGLILCKEVEFVEQTVKTQYVSL